MHVCIISDINNVVLFIAAIGILTPLKDTSSVEGTKAVLEAKISAADISSVKWYHNDKLVVPSERVQVITKGSKQRLVFNRTFASDQGQYKLVVGRVDSSCKLTVESMYFYKNHIFILIIGTIKLDLRLFVVVFLRNSHCETYGRPGLHRNPECHLYG